MTLITDIAVENTINNLSIDLFINSTEGKRNVELLTTAFQSGLYDKTSFTDFIAHLQSMLKEGTCRGEMLSFFEKHGKVTGSKRVTEFRHAAESVILQTLYEVRFDTNLQLMRLKAAETTTHEEPKSSPSPVNSEKIAPTPSSPKKAALVHKKTEVIKRTETSASHEKHISLKTLELLCEKIKLIEKNCFTGMKKIDKFTAGKLSAIDTLKEKLSLLSDSYVVGVVRAARIGSHEFGFITEKDTHTLYDSAGVKTSRLYRTKKIANLCSKIKTNISKLFGSEIETITFSIYTPIASS